MDAPLTSVVDSLEMVELAMELEELGSEAGAPIVTVADYLWLVERIELQKSKRENR